VRVSAQLWHNVPSARTPQLHAAGAVFAHRRSGSASATSVRGSRSKASAVPHVRQRELPKNTMAVQTGQVKARIAALSQRIAPRSSGRARSSSRCQYGQSWMPAP
jgi:hypothetical protein